MSTTDDARAQWEQAAEAIGRVRSDASRKAQDCFDRADALRQQADDARQAGKMWQAVADSIEATLPPALGRHGVHEGQLVLPGGSP